MAFANATVDPEKVTVDLTEARAVVRESRQMAKEQTDPAMELFPLMPWLPPQAAVKGVAELLFSYSEDLPVSCSNLGDLPPQIAQVDGTTAEKKVVLRALDQNVTRREIERSHGQLVVVSARVNGKVVISVEAYEIGGAENTKQRLRGGLVDQTMTDFGSTPASSDVLRGRVGQLRSGSGRPPRRTCRHACGCGCGSIR